MLEPRITSTPVCVPSDSFKSLGAEASQCDKAA